MVRRFILAACAASLVVAVAASTALAGEITGNGKSLKVDGPGKWGTGLHARSLCAYSGQEDLQFLDEEGNPLDEADIVKGVPAHAQSWGQIPKFIRDQLALEGEHPGDACNPTTGFEE